MEFILNETETRILGCLIEKEMTTPEYYPLSLNSLTNACNQKSNRFPVVSYEEILISEGLDSLQEKGLARKTLTGGSRVPKYLHSLLDKFDLSSQELAVLCELMVRGPQTVGEIRTHSDRISPFTNLDEVDQVLQTLMAYVPPMVRKMPKEPGRKEARYMHLLSGKGDPDISAEPAAASSSQNSIQGRISSLEKETALLRTELEELKRTFAEFKSQF
jgi:uncharacterized protein